MPDSILKVYTQETDKNASMLSLKVARACPQKIHTLTRSKVLDKDKLFASVTRYVHENFNKEINLFTLSEEFGVNYYALSNLINDRLNSGFSNYLNGVRTEKAAELLLNPATPISEIAKAAGYASVQYFYKIFKAGYNLTPNEQRDSHCTGSNSAPVVK